MGKMSEPQVTIYLKGANWTKVTFKPDIARFNMTHLDDDAIALMMKRVVDIAGILAQTVQVVLNGKSLRLMNFPHYVNLYLDAASLSATRDITEQIPRIIEKFHDQVEVVVSLTEGEFDQVSFVNKVATTAGGPHVDYVTNQITAYVAGFMNRTGLRPTTEEHEVKRHLWIFINMLVENPTFSSPTKEALIGPLGSLESFKLCDVFMDLVLGGGVYSRLMPRWVAPPERQDKPKRKRVIKKFKPVRFLKKDWPMRDFKSYLG